MYVVCVQIHVKPEHIDEFIQATRENHENTRKLEPGNLRWDCLQAEDDPARFLLYEVYRTKDDFSAHQAMQHYITWRDAVVDWMAEPRVGTRYHNIYPTDDQWSS